MPGYYKVPGSMPVGPGLSATWARDFTPIPAVKPGTYCLASMAY